MSSGMPREWVYFKYSLWDWEKLQEEKIHQTEEQECHVRV